jgi:hypothetical protein
MGVYTLMITIRTLWSASNVFNLLYPFCPIAKSAYYLYSSCLEILVLPNILHSYPNTLFTP